MPDPLSQLAHSPLFQPGEPADNGVAAAFKTLLTDCQAAGVSDLHLSAGARPFARRNEALPNIIRSGKIADIRSVIESGVADGMSLKNAVLISRFRDCSITVREAYMKASEKKTFEPLVAQEHASAGGSVAA